MPSTPSPRTQDPTRKKLAVKNHQHLDMCCAINNTTPCIVAVNQTQKMLALYMIITVSTCAPRPNPKKAGPKKPSPSGHTFVPSNTKPEKASPEQSSPSGHVYHQDQTRRKLAQIRHHHMLYARPQNQAVETQDPTRKEVALRIITMWTYMCAINTKPEKCQP